MRSVGSLTLATLGAFFFGHMVEELAGALTRPKPLESAFEASIWSIIWLVMAGVAFFSTLRMRGATWAIVLPCGVMTVLALLAAVLFPGDASSHFGIEAASLLGLTLAIAHLRTRLDRAIDLWLTRLQPGASD
jgi:cell division protein FtsW (lipid II flippase)